MITFRSPTDQPIHLALVTGHTAMITPQGTDLAEPFHDKAIAAGAIPVDGRSQSPKVKAALIDRKLTIKEAIALMATSGNRGDLRRDGTINLERLIDKVGFPVFEEEGAELYAEVREEALKPKARVVDPLLTAP